MFEIGDVVLAKSMDVYRITDSGNPCVVTMNKKNENMFNLKFRYGGDLVVSPLHSYKESKFPVNSVYFKKIETTNSKYGINKGDQVVLRDVCENILNVPKGSVGKVHSFIEDEEIIDKFGEIVVFFFKLKKYELIRKDYIKHLTTL